MLIFQRVTPITMVYGRYIYSKWAYKEFIAGGGTTLYEWSIAEDDSGKLMKIACWSLATTSLSGLIWVGLRPIDYLSVGLRVSSQLFGPSEQRFRCLTRVTGCSRPIIDRSRTSPCPTLSSVPCRRSLVLPGEAQSFREFRSKNSDPRTVGFMAIISAITRNHGSYKSRCNRGPTLCKLMMILGI